METTRVRKSFAEKVSDVMFGDAKNFTSAWSFGTASLVAGSLLGAPTGFAIGIPFGLAGLLTAKTIKSKSLVEGSDYNEGIYAEVKKSPAQIVTDVVFGPDGGKSLAVGAEIGAIVTGIFASPIFAPVGAMAAGLATGLLYYKGQTGRAAKA